MILLLSFGSVEAQCPTGTNIGNVDVSGYTVGNRTLANNAMWGGDYLTISGVIPGATYTVDFCGNGHDTQVTVRDPNVTTPVNTHHDTNGCTTDDGTVTFVATGTTFAVQHDQGTCNSGAPPQGSVFITLVTAPPSCTAGSFTANPANQDVCPNGMATFTADTVGGGAADSLRWEVSTNGGSTWMDLFNAGPYTGTTTLTLTVNPATTGLNGRQYRCKGYYCSPPLSAFSQAATLLVRDIVDPNITCPGNQTQPLDATCSATLADYTSSASVSDNCDPSPTVTQSPTGSTFSAAGQNISVSLFATDASFNTATCTFTVTAQDVTAPTITCPTNQTAFVGASCTGTLPNYTGAATVSDNCDASPSVTQTPSAGGALPAVGNTLTVSLLAQDASFNSNTCTFSVTVADSTRPVITCPSTQNLVVDASCQASLLDYRSMATASDNCGTPTLTQNPASGTTVSGTGTSNVTIVATDASNNVDSCTFVVDLIDNTIPTLTCPGAQTGIVDGSCNATLPDFTSGVATDNCDPSPMVTQTPAAGATVAGAGNSVTVSLFAQDASSNSTTCTFSFTASDTTPPVAVCQNITVILPGASATIAPGDVNGGSTDNCGTATPTMVSPSTFNCATLGVNNVTLTVDDGNSNTSTCTATVTIQDTSNICCTQLSPAGSLADADYCPGDTVTFTSTLTGTTPISYQWQTSTNGGATWTPLVNGGTSPGISGAMSPTLSLNGVPQAASGTQFRLVASNACSVDSTLSATITGDFTAPTLICPGPRVGFVDSACVLLLPDMTGFATLADNCDPSPTVTQTPAPLTQLNGAGTSVTVTLFAQDASSNSTTCTFSFTTQDNRPPTPVCQTANVFLNSGGVGSIVAADIDGGSTDNCGAVTLAASQTSFNCSDVGNASVTLTVTDASSNVDSCIATVVVADTIPPTIVCRNDTIYLDGSGNAGINSSIAAAASGDACGAPVITLSDTAFTCADIGPNSVIVTATDNSNNTSTCTSTITIQDSVAPTAVCQDVTVHLDAVGNGMITASDVDNGSSDACGIMSLSVDSTMFNCSHAGANTVTLSVMDSSNNVGTCTATVTVLDTVPPVAVCDSLTAFLDAAGNVTVTAASVDGGSSDACGLASVTLPTNTFTCADVGVNTPTLVVTDNNGNMSFCSAQVTVVDTVAPNAVCQDITVQLDASGNVNVLPNLVDNGSTDACGIQSRGLSQGAFTCADVGANLVTLTVGDFYTNFGTCTAIITVEDTLAPIANCQDITVQLDASGNATISAADVDSSSSDACGISSIMVSDTAFTCSDVGVNMVTLTVTDSNSNVSTCMANVTVEDSVAPVANCQNITVQLNGTGNATVAASAIDSASSDACGIASVMLNDTAFTCADVGSNAVTLTVTDNNGNTATCAATVTVEDNVAPTASCQDITVQLDATGMVTIVPSQVDNGSGDACGVTSLALDSTMFDCSEIGLNTVTLTVTDTNSNTASCNAFVTVEDTLPPTAVCQNITVQLDAAGNASITAADVDGGSSDNCGIASLMVSDTSFTCADAGANMVTLTVTDVNGNVSTCTATVTVEDVTPPVATCQNITVQLDANGNATISAADVDSSSNDACGIASLMVSDTSFACADVGANTVTLTVTDNNGNIDSCSATVTVMDTVPPVANCQNVTVQLDANGMATLTAADVDSNSTDACGIASLTVDSTMFSCANVGPNTVTLTVTDNNSNNSTCQATVTVMDTIAPTAVCQNITVQLDATGNASITAADVDGGSSDNCGIASLMVSDTSFACADVGANMVTLTVTDDNGNVSTCTATVRVEDVTPPVANCQNITVQLDVNGNATISAADVDSSSTDACGIASLMVSDTSFTCRDVGANTVTLTVTDNNGNVDSCSATVTVMDTIPPMANCQNITVQLDANGMATITAADVDSNSTDACGIASLAVDSTMFSCANVGPNTVTLTVTDNNSNVSTCQATVTVMDTIAPTAVCQNITVQLDATGNASITAADVDGGSSDNCGIASLMVSDTSFACADVGANMVTLTVTDDNGNVSTCTATVTVEDVTAPVANCQNITVQLDVNGNATITAADVDSNSTDACGIASLMVSDTSFTCADVGANTVTLTVTDNNGNVDSCSATVTVMDTIPPMANCQNITVQLDVNGMATITAADVDSNSTDACGIASLAVDSTMFSCANVGPNTVTLTVTDNNSNVSTCQATVNVMDTIAPMAVCQNITVQLDANGNAPLTAADIDGGSSDACGIASLMASDTSFTCADVGANTVTLTVTDNNGNVSTCTATVMVMDTILPVVNCQNITVQLDVNGMATITAADVDSNSTDACGIASLMVSDTSFTCAEVGANTVTLTVTDNNGNVDSCSATVTVMDTIPPMANCQNITVQLDVNGMATITAADVDSNSTDACGIASLAVDSTMFSCANVGPNTVTLTVTDNNSNVSTCQATVNVMDTIAPMAVCQNITVQLDANGNAPLAAADIDGGSSDACGIASLMASDTSFTCADVGANTVTLTVTDNNGNVSTCTATVMVMDTILPVVNCQNITVQLDVNGMATISAADVDSNSTDACGIASLMVSDTSFTCAEVGANTVTLTVTDNNGNVDSCSATVTVMDTIAPMAVCVADTVYLDSMGMGSTTANDIDGGSSDACGIDSLVLSPTMFSCANIGANTVTLTVTDNNGNSSTCTATVTVLDTVPPMAVCMADTVWLDTNGVASISASDVDGGSSDNCAIASIAIDDSTFDCVNVGPPAVLNELFISEYIEGSGNNKCVEIYNGTGAAVNMTGYTIEVYANGASSPTNTLALSGTVADGDVFVVCNSGATAVFTNLADQTSGLISFNGDDAVVLRNNGQAIDIFGKVGQDPGAAWNQGGNSTVNKTLVRNPDIFQGNVDDLTSFPSLGTEWMEFAQNDVSNLGSHSLIPSGATVTLTVTDSSGNMSSCTAAITVLDTILPTAVCQAATVYLDASGNGSITAADVDGGSTDNCGVNNLSVDTTAFSCSTLGANTVTLTVTDLSNNVSTCTATVTVLDTVAPVVTCQAATVYLDTAGTVSIDTTLINGGSSDACGIDTMYLSRNMLSCADLGAASVTLFGEDASGNVDSCTATVTVLDTLAPIVTCVADTVYLDSLGAGTYSTTQQPAPTDNCTIDTTFLAQTNFACSDVGVNQVTFYAVDQSMNIDSCVASLTVLDTVPPAITCMDTTVMVDSAGSVTIDVTFVDGGNSDACGVDTTFLSQYTFGCSDLGANAVTFSVVDVNGNQSNCTAMVTVDPEPLTATVTAPVLACGHNIACNGDMTATATATGEGACLTFSYLWSTSDTTATITGLGAGTYTVTVTDQLMRTVIDTIVITEPAPLATSIVADTYVCADDSSANVDLTVTGGLDCAAYTFVWSNGATTEDLTGVSHGSYTVTVTDTLGCSIIDSVTIVSQPLPTISLGPDLTKCAEDSILVDAGPGYSSYLWSTGATTAATFLQSGSYWVEISDSLGCTNRDTIEILDYVVPDSIIAPLGSLFLCGGDSVELMAFSGYQSYLWNTGATTQMITVVDTGGDYSVIAIDSNGCQVKDTMTVNYNPFLDPRPVIIPGPQYNLCEGNTDTLDAGAGYFSYLWNTGATTRKIPVSANGTFVVTVTNGFGCSASSDTVTVTEVPLPVPTISKSNGNLYSDSVWTTYQWLLDGQPIPGGTWDSLAPQAMGAYSLMATDSNGCEGVSDTIFCNPVAIADQFTPIDGLELYPNPTSGMVYLRSLQPIDWNLTVTMTDMYGQVVKQYTMAHLVRETAFDLRDLANGMYVMEIVTEKGARATFRVVIE